MSTILEGLEGTVCLIDVILVFGRDAAEHETRLKAVLERIELAGVTLNLQKCQFNKTSLSFLGHLIDQSGIRADPDKTSAIREMEAPTTVSELRRFMGMINQLGKFTPNLAHLTQPLRELLSKKRTWLWGPEQDNAFSLVKAELSKPTTLSLDNPEAETIRFQLTPLLLAWERCSYRCFSQNGNQWCTHHTRSRRQKNGMPK